MEGDNIKVTIYDYARMCKTIDNCPICPLNCENNGKGVSCSLIVTEYPDIANEIILKWFQENLLKSRQDRLIHLFPNVKIEDGILDLCPAQFEGSQCLDKLSDLGFSKKIVCMDCCKKYWLEEI